MAVIAESGVSLAVVGATGQVGGKMLEILAQREFPIRELRLFASPRSAGKQIDYKGASGDLDFDANGDVPGSYALFKVAGDDYEVLTEMK